MIPLLSDLTGVAAKGKGPFAFQRDDGYQMQTLGAKSRIGTGKVVRVSGDAISPWGISQTSAQDDGPREMENKVQCVCYIPLDPVRNARWDRIRVKWARGQLHGEDSQSARYPVLYIRLPPAPAWWRRKGRMTDREDAS